MRLLFQICVVLPLAVCALSCISGSGTVRAAEKTAVYHNVTPSGKVQFIMPEGFYKVREDYVSPHIPWGKPYAGGAIKALIIGCRYAHRETGELAQRLSLEYETIMMLGKTGEFIPKGLTDRLVGCSAEDFRAEFEEKLAGDYDVIILG